MSLLPFLLENAPHHLLDQRFGINLNHDDVLATVPMMARDYYRPWWQRPVPVRDIESTIESTIKSTKDKFQVNLDVQHFSPEDISVKTVDGFVIIEGKHEEKKDEHGYVTRHFCRRYALPKKCDPATVVSMLSSDGVLTVSAPKGSPASKNERCVPIAHTGPVRKEVKDAACQPWSHAEGNGTAK